MRIDKFIISAKFLYEEIDFIARNTHRTFDIRYIERRGLFREETEQKVGKKIFDTYPYVSNREYDRAEHL